MSYCIHLLILVPPTRILDRKVAAYDGKIIVQKAVDDIYWRAKLHDSGEFNQIKSIESNLFVTQNTDTNERSKTKSNVPTGHKRSRELH